MTALMERADWTDFRHVDGLVARGGIGAGELRRLIAKELLDNALDAADEAGTAAPPALTITDDGTIVVDDDGPGIPGDPADVARLFAFGRDRLSSKYARRPTRGMLGNGLRLVSGAVFASSGRLEVVTGNRRHRLTPMQDGTTAVESEPAERSTGTRVSVWLDPQSIRPDDRIELWLQPALWMFGGDRYVGRSSPHWFDGPTFFEYFQAARGLTVRAAVGQLARCTSAAAGELTRRWSGPATALSPADAAELLAHLQGSVDPVAPDLLKPVGRRDDLIGGALGLECYAREATTFVPPSAAKPRAHIPVLIEVWAGPSDDHDRIQLCVNRSPSTARLFLSVYPDGAAKLAGCGLSEHGQWVETKRRSPALVLVNVTAPHLPRTSDGKAPDLGRLARPLCGAIARALDAVERSWPSPKDPKPRKVVAIKPPKPETKTFDAAVREQLDASIDEVSGAGVRRYTQRQLFYNVRSALLAAAECEGELKWGTFTKIVDRVEAERGGDLPGMTRDPRGLVYHPHTGETMPLGTLAVEAYRRPEWLFGNVLYIEKEGFFSILQEDGWPNRWDCSIMSAKGQSTRAAKDFIDHLAATGEPVRVFCLHDADAAGTMIYQALQEATIARPRRSVEIVNLGLEPWKAREMGLQDEPVDQLKQRRPVADYVVAKGDDWAEWLQRRRYELDSIPPDRFVPWLEAKMTEHGAAKVVPDGATLRHQLRTLIDSQLREGLTERLTREARIEERVDELMAGVLREIEAAVAGADDLAGDIRDTIDRYPSLRWSDRLGAIAHGMASGIEPR